MTPDQLAAIHAASFTTPRPWTADEFAGFLSSRLVFLLEEPGGFLLGRVIADEAELLTLAVAPEHRRNGSGGRLVQGFLDEAAARGAASAFLEVAEGNAPARALYARAGFVESGRRPAYYHHTDGRSEAAIIMQLGLAARRA